MTRVYIVDLDGRIVYGIIYANICFIIAQMAQLGGIYFSYGHRQIFIPAHCVKRLETA